MPVDKERWEALVLRADAAGAMANIEDAEVDLSRWPQFEQMILADLERAIEAHEQKAFDTSVCEPCKFSRWVPIRDTAQQEARVLTCTAHADQCPLKTAEAVIKAVGDA